MFEREDWTLFRNLGTLSQKAGVPLHLLRRLAVKELVDNALDAGGLNVEVGKVGRHTYWVQDDGAGIPGSGEAIARLFSVARPLASTKVLRLPVRGALGNGLRVVVGAVLATGGRLVVRTRGHEYALTPQDDGTTRIDGDVPVPTGGTRVTVTFGVGLPEDSGDLEWANLARRFRAARSYAGKTSAWWYDVDSWFELLRAAGTRPLLELLHHFDGVGDARGETPAAPLLATGSRPDAAVWPATCDELDRDDATALLTMLREKSKPVPPGRIGLAGADAWPGGGYAKETGVLSIAPGRSGAAAELPFVVECWALAREDQDDDDQLIAFANGTPIAGTMRVERSKPTKVAVFGCGLRHYVERVSPKKATVLVNITTPYVPITTDGKEPDLSRYLGPLGRVISRATRKLKGSIRRAENRVSQQTMILRGIDEGVQQASGGGKYRYSLRQLYYAVRPAVIAANDGRELNYDHFARVMTAYEAEYGELPGMYRDPRGNLYHPHLRRSIPLGTLAVEEYRRPHWTFNKILYLEKEGFAHLLQSVGWPERHDCAILSSKGFASRAVRDVLDLLGDTDEEILFFCVHDADASGTLIYQALQEGTTARRARRVKIVNLGLEPWEAVRMGLDVESFEVKGSRKLPVARYVSAPTVGRVAPPRASGADDWEQWLQGRRCELNAMTSPRFLEWIDKKLAPYDNGKVVPPRAVLHSQMLAETESAIRHEQLELLAREHGLEARVRDLVERRRPTLDALDLERMVADGLEVAPAERWTDTLVRYAAGHSPDTLSRYTTGGPPDADGVSA